MGYNSKQIQALVSSGADAMSNIFDVNITFPTALSSDTTMPQSARVRIKDSISIPAPDTGTYTIAYHGVEITRPSTTMTLERKLTLKFRLDASYKLYECFVKWHNYATDPNTGSFADFVDTDKMTGTIKIIQLAGDYLAKNGQNNMADLLGSNDEVQANKNITPQWIFKNVWVSKVSTPQFQAGKDGSNMDFDVDFVFDDIQYPFYTDYGMNASTGSSTTA